MMAAHLVVRRACHWAEYSVVLKAGSKAVRSAATLAVSRAALMVALKACSRVVRMAES